MHLAKSFGNPDHVKTCNITKSALRVHLKNMLYEHDVYGRSFEANGKTKRERHFRSEHVLVRSSDGRLLTVAPKYKFGAN